MTSEESAGNTREGEGGKYRKDSHGCAVKRSPRRDIGVCTQMDGWMDGVAPTAYGFGSVSPHVGSRASAELGRAPNGPPWREVAVEIVRI